MAPDVNRKDFAIGIGLGGVTASTSLLAYANIPASAEVLPPIATYRKFSSNVDPNVSAIPVRVSSINKSVIEDRSFGILRILEVVAFSALMT